MAAGRARATETQHTQVPSAAKDSGEFRGIQRIDLTRNRYPQITEIQNGAPGLVSFRRLCNLRNPRIQKPVLTFLGASGAALLCVYGLHN